MRVLHLSYSLFQLRSTKTKCVSVTPLERSRIASLQSEHAHPLDQFYSLVYFILWRCACMYFSVCSIEIIYGQRDLLFSLRNSQACAEAHVMGGSVIHCFCRPSERRQVLLKAYCTLSDMQVMVASNHIY